ncbi:MAG: hypothetical protein QW797_06610 [Thermoproteota archaeon]
MIRQHSARFGRKYGSIPSLNPDVIACRTISSYFKRAGMLLRKGLVEPDAPYMN